MDKEMPKAVRDRMLDKSWENEPGNGNYEAGFTACWEMMGPVISALEEIASTPYIENPFVNNKTLKDISRTALAKLRGEGE